MPTAGEEGRPVSDHHSADSVCLWKDCSRSLMSDQYDLESKTDHFKGEFLLTV